MYKEKCKLSVPKPPIELTQFHTKSFPSKEKEATKSINFCLKAQSVQKDEQITSTSKCDSIKKNKIRDFTSKLYDSEKEELAHTVTSSFTSKENFTPILSSPNSAAFSKSLHKDKNVSVSKINKSKKKDQDDVSFISPFRDLINKNTNTCKQPYTSISTASTKSFSRNKESFNEVKSARNMYEIENVNMEHNIDGNFSK